MTFYELLPALFLIFAFAFFCVYTCLRLSVFLAGCGGCLTALCPALAGCRIRVCVAVFFAYIAAVYAGRLIRILCGRRAERLAVVTSGTDSRKGRVLYGGRVYPAYSRDALYVYKEGEVLRVREMPDGTLCGYRS